MLAALKVRVGVSAVRGLAARGLAARGVEVGKSEAPARIITVMESVANKIVTKFVGTNKMTVNGQELTVPKQLYGHGTDLLNRAVKDRNVNEVITALRTTLPHKKEINEQEIRKMLGLKK